MGAILVMPAEVRAARFSRELDRFVIEALRAVKRQGGDQAFNRTARDLVISVCAILAYERGTNAVVDLFDVIERVLGMAAISAAAKSLRCGRPGHQPSPLLLLGDRRRRLSSNFIC